jgi:hypothetical protein
MSLDESQAILGPSISCLLGERATCLAQESEISGHIIEKEGKGASSATSLITQRVFLNQDLVKTIVDNYADGLDEPGASQGTPQSTSKRRRGLRELCTTSRTFFEATADGIWRELPSIIPLFNLLPQSERSEYVGIPSPLVFNQVPDDFAR